MNRDLKVKTGEQIGAINLNREAGISELEQIYKDVYDYDLGQFTKMSSKSKGQYNEDLRRFYTAFTGKKACPLQ